MKFSINPPKGFLGWTIYLIIGKFIIDIAKYLYNHRGSSNETKEDMKEIREALASQPTKEDIREIIREENKNLATKEEVTHVRKELSLETKTEIALKFKDMEIMLKEAILKEKQAEKFYEEAKTEHRNGKRRNEEIFLKISEKLGNEKRTKK